jgi:hypothetical protein
MNKYFQVLVSFTMILAAFSTNLVFADGAVVDKINHPYVDALESEIEYRVIFQDSQPGISSPAQLHKISYGRAFGQRLFAEVYLITEKTRAGDFDQEAYEFELKWQLTEQGEYAIDWGMLFEYENGIHKDVEEIKLGFIAEKEWGRWSGSANLFLINEWGDDIEDESETAAAFQARYRHSRLFEPALELYVGQNTTGIGPVVMGNINAGTRKNINWEAGVIFGLDSDSPNQTWRVLFEYEF